MANQICLKTQGVSDRTIRLQRPQQDCSALIRLREDISTPLKERDLHIALDIGTISPHYQTRHHVNDAQISGFEALARWYHHARGSIPPSVFVGLAENARDGSLIRKLGEAITSTAIQQFATWRKNGNVDLGATIGINVSPRHINQDGAGYVRYVMDLAERFEIPPQVIDIEITETSRLSEKSVIAFIADAREHGINIALDDFGTGYSCLSLLQDHPVNIVKFDRSLTTCFSSSARHRAIAKHLVSMSSDIGVRVVTEGVETADQMCFLKNIGCHEAQGYLFSQARPAADMHLPVAAESERVELVA